MLVITHRKNCFYSGYHDLKGYRQTGVCQKEDDQNVGNQITSYFLMVQAQGLEGVKMVGGRVVSGSRDMRTVFR